MGIFFDRGNTDRWGCTKNQDGTFTLRRRGRPTRTVDADTAAAWLRDRADEAPQERHGSSRWWD